MYADAGLVLSGPFSLGFSKARKYDLRANKPHIDMLGQLLYDGDDSVIPELVECHMRVAAGIAKGVAHRFRQDLEEMVAYAYLGLVDGCDRLYRREAKLTNVSGYLITRAKSLCVNNCIDVSTGFSQKDIKRSMEMGLHLLSRKELKPDLVASENPDIAVQEFLESFLPSLTDMELDVFLYFLRGYTNEEVRDELRRSPATVSTVKTAIRDKFEKWMLEWHKK